MANYQKLLKTLKQELENQTELLEVLANERVHIIKMNKAGIEEIGQEKRSLLKEAGKLQKERDQIVSDLGLAGSPVKLSDLIERCDSREERFSLERVGASLKRAATGVNEMNTHNAILIRQALGLVVSTMSILRSAGDDQLPTYNAGGTVEKEHNSKVASPSRRVLARGV